MNKKENLSGRVSRALDVPLDVICDIPRIEIMGKSSVSVENFRGIIDFGENAVKLNTTAGILEIRGNELMIESITDEALRIYGEIIGVNFV